MSRVAAPQVKKWREEVARAKAVREPHGGVHRAGGDRGARQLRSPPRAAAPVGVLRDNAAALDADLQSFAYGAGAPRRRSGSGSGGAPAAAPAERERWRAAFQRCVGQGGGGAAAARLSVRLFARQPQRCERR
jgi:hypothetical protein